MVALFSLSLSGVLLASVVMLYVDAEVNGTKLKAFVDSGAQNTIMSIKCAERCGIMRLVDRRFAGEAVGVGKAKIVGKVCVSMTKGVLGLQHHWCCSRVVLVVRTQVHLAELKVGGQRFNCSFTVLDQNDMDFLFGLDMLKRHQYVHGCGSPLLPLL